MTMISTMARFAAPAMLGLGLLAGCSSEPSPTPPAEDNYEEVQPPEPAPTPPPVVEATPAPPPVVTENLVEPPEPPVDPDDQTLEDADATGLTTRATRSDEDDGASSANGE